MSNKKSTKLYVIELFFVVMLFIIVLFFIIMIFGREKRSEVIVKDNTEAYNVLLCSSNKNENAFFSIDGASEIKHAIKIILIGDKIDRLFYMYEGKFRDDEMAEKASTSMNAKYDLYLDENNNPSSREVENTFSHIGNKVRVDLYTGVEGINFDTSVFFFLDNDSLDELIMANGDKLKDYYFKKGFICNYQE